MMRSCNLTDLMQELKPWLDNDHIKEAFLDDKGHLVLLFRDGIKNVYAIDDCNQTQIEAVLQELKDRGIAISC